MTTDQHDAVCAILDPAFESRQSGHELLVAIDRLCDDDDDHPVAAFLRVWFARPGRDGRRGWVIGSGDLGDRITVRLSAVEVAGPDAVECELMVRKDNRVQVWVADVPLELGRRLAGMWGESSRREARRRAACLPTNPGSWFAHARHVAAAVLGVEGGAE